MDSVFTIAAVALCLACPVIMVGFGLTGWVIARARGQKKDFSASCMQHGDHTQTSAQTEDSALRDQVTQLQAEVESLRAQRSTAGSAVDNGAAVAHHMPDPH